MYDKRYTKSIANPFNNRSSKFFPKTIQECFDWAQYMHDRFPSVGRAVNKVVRYFAADVSVINTQGPSKTDTEKMYQIESLMKQKYNILQLVIRIGQQLAIMGNVFVYSMPVINRVICCPKCKQFIMDIQKVVPKVDFQWQKGQIKGVCPQCGQKTVFPMVDKMASDNRGRKMIFRILSPRDMQIKYNEITGQYTYLYKMPSHIRQGIISGDPVYLRSTPQVFLKAAFSSDFIEFPAQRLLHLRTDTLSTMDRYYKGWGTPLFLSSFNNILRLAYLDKFNEAVATDFIAPIRMISPPAQNLMAGADPMRQPISGHAVKNFIMEAIKGVRENPSQWVVSPFPLQYQMLGGQAKQLAPVQLMKWYQDRILQDQGIPMQLRQTTFQAVAATNGLRMFQRMWIHYSQNLQTALDWISGIICEKHNITQIKVSLDKTSFVQDDMHKQTILGMAGSGMLSQDTVLRTIGLDYKQEINKKFQEEQFVAQETMKNQAAQQESQMLSSVLPPAGSEGIGAAQYNMEMVMQANQPAPPEGAGGAAAPAPAGGAMPPMPAGTQNSQPAVLEALFQQAEQTAQEIFQTGVTMGAGARRSALIKLKQQNPTLHAQVKAILQNMDQQTASQAVAQSKMPQ